MKLNRANIFISISSLALLIVLLIQVNWILETAKIKEALFNEKANMVLSRTTEALRSDKETCRKIEACVEIADTGGIPAKLGKNEVQIIDSIFAHFMNFYNFHVDYSFVVIKPTAYPVKNGKSFASTSFNKTLGNSTGENEIELKLILPDKKQFIIAELGPLFITSVILIVVVLVMFWQTILSLMKEKKISEHTNEFLNNMTHEFKTPLTNIALAGKMITKDITIQQPEKIKHYSGIILDENEKLRLQVELVLNMTALERGEIPLQKAALDFHQLINEVLKQMRIQIEHQNGSLTVHTTAEQFIIKGDKTHLINALCNLVDNAIKYCKGNPELLIETSNLGDRLILVVADKGIGIEKEYQHKVFDKYFRVPTGDVHDVKGFGLGLAYVKKIIELHGGSIALQSEKDKGTIFTITIPYA